MNLSTRQPRHLKYKDSELRSNQRFLRDSCLLLPNGKKLHEVRSTNVDTNEYCLSLFGQTEASLIEELKRNIVKRHEDAVNVRAKAQMIINSPIFSDNSIDIELALREVEKLLKPCAKQEYLDSIYELGLLYMEHGSLLGKGEADYYPLVKKAVKKGHSDAPYNLAVHHLKKQEWVEAEEFLLIGAKKEDCSCLNKLAEMAEEGVTNSLSKSDAARYYERAMRKGLPYAAINLARLIFAGEDKKHSVQDAVSFLEEAARDGEVKAMCQLGIIYEEGQYVEADFKKSLSFYQQAADLGDANGQFFLGFIYRNLWEEFGLEKNLSFGITLYKKAAAQGHQEAIDNLYKANLSSLRNQF